MWVEPSGQNLSEQQQDRLSSASRIFAVPRKERDDYWSRRLHELARHVARFIWSDIDHCAVRDDDALRKRWEDILRKFRCVLVEDLRVDIELKAIQKSRPQKALAVWKQEVLLLDSRTALSASRELDMEVVVEIAKLFTDEAIGQRLYRDLMILSTCTSEREMQKLVDNPKIGLAPLPEEEAIRAP